MFVAIFHVRRFASTPFLIADANSANVDIISLMNQRQLLQMANHLLCLLFLSCWIAASSGQNIPQSRWRWPDDRPPPPHPAPQPAILRSSGSPGPVRIGAGRLIPSAPSNDKINQPIPQKFQLPIQPKPFTPLPIRPLTSAPPSSPPGSSQPPFPQPPPQRPPQPPQQSAPPPPKFPVSSTPPIQQTPEVTEEAPVEPVKNKSSVPLLKDAGKPGNPYVLLNDIFPPEKSIRTKEEEEANFENLLKADLGGLDPHEVYLADNDLFVVRGFNFKKPYNPDPAGPPIDNYVAPAPNPPPAPEPGTVFYPSNDTDAQFPEFFPDFNVTDGQQMPPFVPFIPAGLNGTEPGFFPGFPPFPFLPPPPPHWDSEKEFNEINSPGSHCYFSLPIISWHDGCYLKSNHAGTCRRANSIIVSTRNKQKFCTICRFFPQDKLRPTSPISRCLREVLSRHRFLHSSTALWHLRRPPDYLRRFRPVSRLIKEALFRRIKAIFRQIRAGFLHPEVLSPVSRPSTDLSTVPRTLTSRCPSLRSSPNVRSSFTSRRTTPPKFRLDPTDQEFSFRHPRNISPLVTKATLLMFPSHRLSSKSLSTCPTISKRRQLRPEWSPSRNSIRCRSSRSLTSHLFR